MRRASSQIRSQWRELRDDLAGGMVVVDWPMVAKLTVGVTIFVVGCTLWSIFLFVPLLGGWTIGLDLLTAAATAWGFAADSGDLDGRR